jgi:hypothetical protein
MVCWEVVIRPHVDHNRMRMDDIVLASVINVLCSHVLVAETFLRIFIQSLYIFVNCFLGTIPFLLYKENEDSRRSGRYLCRMRHGSTDWQAH